MNKKGFSNKIFAVVLLLLSCAILYKLAINSNTYNYADNRMSIKFNMPTIKSFINGSFQKEVESATADQMPKYDYFKLSYLKVVNYINIKTITLLGLNKSSKYINLGNIYLFNDYLLYGSNTNKNLQKNAQDDIKEINKINKNTNANIYLYFIETDSNYNFEDNKKTNLIEYLKNNLEIDKNNISFLNISTFENYKKYFYKTDHHWNHQGSYQGYKEIASLMKFNNILSPEDEVCFDKIESEGSKSKRIADIKIIQDTMCIYNFKLPEYDIYINKEKESNYGNTLNELKKMSKISYGTIYGWDYAEIKFINKQSNNNKKLLIYANSFSNSINKLLAASYKETYVIDGRHYKEKSMIEYINENKIDDVLILSNNMLFSDEINW